MLQITQGRLLPIEQELLEQASTYCHHLSLSELSADRLLTLFAERGSDFATTVAYQSVCCHSAHAELVQRFDRLSETQNYPRFEVSTALGLIPNLGYSLDNKPQQTAARMFDLASRFGLDSFVVPTSHTMDLAANARLICDTLLSRAEERIILVSLSKGSSDLKIALGQAAASQAFERVTSWINICGLLDGTAIVNLVLDNRDAETEAQIVGWFKRRGDGYIHLIMDALRDCGHGPGRPLGGPLTIPAHIRTYHVVVFPLQRHFQYEHSRILNQVLLQLGPNDCFALIADQINKPGAILPIWGSDHYIYQAIDLNRVVAPLLRVVHEDCEASR